MHITDLLSQVRRSGVKLGLEGAQLRYSAPQGAMSDELRRRIASHKPELIGVYRTANDVSKRMVRQRPSGADLPKTPNLEWYLQTFDPRNHDWAITVFIEFPGRVDVGNLQSVINELVDTHDAFRLRFLWQGPDGWALRMDTEAVYPRVGVYNFTNVTTEHAMERIGEAALELRMGLSIIDGPVVRVGVCRLCAPAHDGVLLVIHHTIVDAYSVQLLTEELIGLYRTRQGTKEFTIRENALTYKEYLFRVRSLTEEMEFLLENIAFWIASDRLHEQVSIPRDFPGGRHTVSTSRRISTELSSRLLAQLRVIAAGMGVSLHDLFLHALCDAFHKWTGAGRFYVDLEHHGRGVLGSSTSLMQTVGPMTVKVPLLLDAEALLGDYAALAREVHGTVDRGLGYGLLRYCCRDSSVKAKMTTFPAAQVLFNSKIGVAPTSDGVTTAEPEGFLVRDLAAPSAPGRDDPVSYDILIDCDDTVDGVRISWTYSSALHLDQTIQALADGFFESIHSQPAELLQLRMGYKRPRGR